MINYSKLIELPLPLPSKTGWPWAEESVPLNNTIADSSFCPKVTIVTPSYNQAEFLEETIRSVLLQDYPNLEYIIIDGGSTDGSVDIIRKYETWISYWVSELDKGQADAINKGFERASGEFLGWINSDDYLYPGAIAKMVTELEKNPDVSLVYGDVDVGLDSKNLDFRCYGEPFIITKLETFRPTIPQQGSMWRRSVIEQAGGLDPRWNVVLDREFFIRVGLKFKIVYKPGVVGFFRLHSSSKSVSKSIVDDWLKEIPLMYHEFFNRNDLSDEIKALKKQAMVAVYTYCSLIALRKDKPRLCFVFIVKAIREDSIFAVLIYVYREIFRKIISLPRLIKFRTVEFQKNLRITNSPPPASFY